MEGNFHTRYSFTGILSNRTARVEAVLRRDIPYDDRRGRNFIKDPRSVRVATRDSMNRVLRCSNLCQPLLKLI